MRLWKVDTGEESHRFEGHSAEVGAVAFSSDGKILASASKDRTVRLWNLGSGQEIHHLEGHSDEVRAISFSPDDKILASGSDDRKIRLWDVDTGNENKEPLEGHSGWVRAITFSPGGETLASASDDRTVRLWDMASGQEIQRLEGHSSLVRAVSFSPGGNTLAWGSDDSTVRMWDRASGQEIHRLEGHSSLVRAVAFSPDGKTLASGSVDRTVQLWDVATGKGIRRLEGCVFAVRAVAFNADGKTLAAASEDHIVRLWNAASGQEIRRLEGHTGAVHAVAFSPDGRILASASADFTVRLWDMASGREIGRLEGLPEDRGEGETRETNAEGEGVVVVAVAFSPDGKTLAAESSAFTIGLWNVASGEEIRRLEGHTGWIRSVAFSPDGKTLLSGSYDRSIRLWDPASGEEIRRFDGHSDRVRAVAFSPGGETVVSGADDGTVRLWDVASGTEIRRLQANRVRSVAFSPDGETVAIGSYDFAVRLWDVASHTETSLGGHSDVIRTVAFSPDGKYLASGSDDVTVRVWEKSENGSFHAHRVLLAGPRETWASCQPDGRCLRYDDGTLLLDKNEQGEMRPVLPSTADRTNLEVLAVPSSVETTLGQVTSFTIRVRNNGAARAFWINVQRADPSSTDPFGFFPPPTRAFLDPATEWEFPCGVSTHTDLRNSQRHRKFLKLGITSAHGDPVSVDRIKIKLVGMPRGPWPWYALLSFLVLVSGFGIVGLWFYSHPLVLRLSTRPKAILTLAPGQLGPARKLLRRTRRLDSVLAVAAVDSSWLDSAVAFIADVEPAARSARLAERFGVRAEGPNADDPALWTLPLGPGFPLDLDECLLYLPPADRPAADVATKLRQRPETLDQVTLVLSADPSHQEKLHELASDLTNLWVAPSGVQLTSLLLAADPVEELAQLVASQVRLTRISPYQTGGGTDRASMFFGRHQILAQILNREPANYLVTGARQIGKSSLLKAIHRHFRDHPRVACHYIVLTGPDLVGRLARAGGLPRASDLDAVMAHLADADRRHLVLIDEADAFVRAERGRGYPTLAHLRSLSEAGICHFILAGFWDLYQAVFRDYRSPLKNFGETLTLDALEKDACRQLVSRPMATMNLRYESDELIEQLVNETGQRPNLISIACNEILKSLDAKDRAIRVHDVDRALSSPGIANSLADWKILSGGEDPASDRLDRILVYASIGEETLTLADALRIMDERRHSVPPEKVELSLDRLELAFVLARDGERYRYPIPLFRKMVLAQQPERLLEWELSSAGNE